MNWFKSFDCKSVYGRNLVHGLRYANVYPQPIVDLALVALETCGSRLGLVYYCCSHRWSHRSLRRLGPAGYIFRNSTVKNKQYNYLLCTFIFKILFD